MNLDLDSGGALAAAALAARAIEGEGAPPARAAHVHTSCANCGAVLTGPFCHRCGQRDHVHRSLLHLGEEFLHGLLHFDTRSWRTLPLLAIQPGRLTRNYIDGKRTRYVSPLALFLFMVFLMFFVVSSLTHVGGGGHGKGDQGGKGGNGGKGPIVADVARAKAALAGAEKGLAAAKASGHGVTGAQAAVDAAREVVDNEEAAQAVGDSLQGPHGAAGDDMGAVVKKLNEKSSKINTGYPSVDAAARFALSNPQFTLYKLKNAASKFSFLLVPMSLPFLWLIFFWKKGVTMFDHAVFTLYGLSFMALLVIVAALLSAASLDGVAGTLVLLAPPIHMFAQLRGTYGLKIFSALWRTIALLVAALLVIGVYLLLILMVSMAT